MSDQKVLRELLEYDPTTGILTWLPRTPDQFPSENESRARNRSGVWNARYAGKPAFTAVTVGKPYHTGSIWGVKIPAHRAIWIWMTGEVPNIIDHINGNGLDNRWVNLRNVDAAGNARNRRVVTPKSDGLPTRVRKHRNRFEVSVGKWQEFIGSFKTLDEAVAARDKAWAERGYHENHGTPRD